MKYLCLVYGEEGMLDAMPGSEAEALKDESLAYDETLRERGHLLAAEALQPSRTARTVRVRRNQLLLTDGPFAETREQLGGFILVEARDHDEAVQLAANIPLARLWSVEVRPIKVLEKGG